jgi:hypothetical protein
VKMPSMPFSAILRYLLNSVTDRIGALQAKHGFVNGSLKLTDIFPLRGSVTSVCSNSSVCSVPISPQRHKLILEDQDLIQFIVSMNSTSTFLRCVFINLTSEKLWNS